MTILVVGGTGKTGLKLARLLRAANTPFIVTSRSGTAPESLPAVKFDWFDPSTFSAPFEKDPEIDKVYLVGPPSLDMLTIMKPFVDLAIEKGVKRWVLLSTVLVEKGGPHMGKVHTYLEEKGVQYTVLRPSWFHENFALRFIESIKKQNEIITAADNGRLPFISAQDIAQAGFEALTTDEYKNAEPVIVGPELLTYDDAAALLSEVSGRKITHRRVSVEEMKTFWLQIGLPEEYATMMALAEKDVAGGAEEKAFNKEGGKDVKYVGKVKLRKYLEENKELWAPA